MSPKDRVLKSLRKAFKKAYQEIYQHNEREKYLRKKLQDVVAKKLRAQERANRAHNEITVINAPYRRWAGKVPILSPQAREIIDRETRKGK